MLDDVLQIWDSLTSRGFTASIVLLLLILLARWLLMRFIDRNTQLSVEMRLRWSGLIRNASFMLIILGLALIWAPQLRTLALSITAFAVAMVIATKELILCISGSLIKTSSNTFSVGDLIEIKSYKGYVISQNLWTTTLRELNSDSLSPSGNDITIPNSLFVSEPICNHSPLSPYIVHTFLIYLDIKPNLLGRGEKILASALEKHWRTLQNNATFQQLARSQELLLTKLEPTVRITTSKEARLCFSISVCCHEDECLALESAITRQLLTASSHLPSGEINQLHETTA